MTLTTVSGRLAAVASKSNGAWQVTLFSYDADGRVSKRYLYTEANGGASVLTNLNTSITYARGLRDAVTQRSDTTGTSFFYQWSDYDGRGLLWKVSAATTNVKPGTPDVTYTYRPSGQVASRLFSGGPTVPITYTIREQLAQIGDPVGTTYPFSAKYSYNANSTIRTGEFYSGGSPAANPAGTAPAGVAPVYPIRYTAPMNPVREIREAVSLTQLQLAVAAGTSQSAVAAYESGRKSPTWRTMERLADAAGCLVELRVLPPLTREDRRSLALHAAVAERLHAEPADVLRRAQQSLARMRALHPDARALLDEWKVLLRRPLDALLPVLTDPSPWARELRHVTPFTGVLSAKERARIYRAFAVSEPPHHRTAHSLGHAS